jgi:hypothetical protein
MHVFWRKVSRRRWQLVNERDQVLRTVMAREPHFRVSNRYVVFGQSWVFGESSVTSTHGSLEEAQAVAEKSLQPTGVVGLHDGSQATAAVLHSDDGAEDMESSARPLDATDAVQAREVKLGPRPSRQRSSRIARASVPTPRRKTPSGLG